MQINFNPGKMTPIHPGITPAKTEVPGVGQEAGIIAEKPVKPVIGEKAAFSSEVLKESRKGSSQETSDRLANLKKMVGGEEAVSTPPAPAATDTLTEKPQFTGKLGETLEENPEIKGKLNQALDMVAENRVEKTAPENLFGSDPKVAATVANIKQVNPHLDPKEIKGIIDQHSSQTGALNRDAAVKAAKDFTSINHPEVKNMASAGAEMLDNNPNLTPGELKNIFQETSKNGADALNGKAGHKVAGVLDNMIKDNPKLTNQDAKAHLQKIAQNDQDGKVEGSESSFSLLSDPVGDIKAQNPKLSKAEIDKILITTSEGGKINPDAALTAAGAKQLEQFKAWQEKAEANNKQIGQIQELRGNAAQAVNKGDLAGEWENTAKADRLSREMDVDAISEKIKGQVSDNSSQPQGRMRRPGESVPFGKWNAYIREDDATTQAGQTKKDSLGANLAAGIDMYVQSQTGSSDPGIENPDADNHKKVQKNSKSGEA